MSARSREHRVEMRRSSIAGIEAMSLTSAHSFPRHFHDRYGVGVIDRGAQKSWSGVGAVEAEAGDVITVNPGEVHDGAPLGGAARAWRMLYLDPAVVARELEDLDGKPEPSFEIARPVAHDPLLARRFSALFAACSAPEPLARGQALVVLLTHLVRRYAAKPRPTALPRGHPSVARARARIDEDPSAPVALAELAAEVGTDRFRLLRGFAREVGLTPRAYLVQRRLTRARDLIRGGTPLADAATAAGFADQSHMNRLFVRHLGVTPGRYAAAVA